MRPLVSAAAAVLLLAGGKRGGGAPPSATNDLDEQLDDLQDTTLDQMHQQMLHNTYADSDAHHQAMVTDADVDVDEDVDTDTDQQLDVYSSSSETQSLQNANARSVVPFADWDWTNPPDDSSIWTATAAVLGGLGRSNSSSPGSTPTKDSPPKDAMEVLSAALHGLRATITTDDSHSDSDSDDSLSVEKYDVRPLIAVTIGVTLFLLTRSPKASHRAELNAGAGDGTIIVDDDDDLIAADTREYSKVSDMRSTRRNIIIVTTAALPWMTGTAVNPLLRAVYLAKAGHTVSLVVPWLESPEDQKKVYPKGVSFKTKQEQAGIIMQWANDQVENSSINIRFYEAIYYKEYGSILPLGDITSMFANDEVRDVCVLEEPEHLTWHHTGARWTSLFNFCVGVVHTNYIEYAKHGVFGPQRALFVNFLNKWVCRSYCHRVIKLSDAVQTLPHSVTCNVHGVRNKFIDIGRKRNGQAFQKGAYFLGKVLWAKGYRELVGLMDEHYERTDERLPVDFFGAGPDLEELRRRVKSSYSLSLVDLHGLVVDHASEYLQRYKVYVNPSKSDVVCTATAEALAMGKFVVCLKHPSNEFFATFDNCLIYETPEQFSALIKFALANEPKPLSEDDAFRLSWEAATERFYDASYIPSVGRVSGRVDSALALTHKTICATLFTPPANMAVRDRYRTEGQNPGIELLGSARSRRARSKATIS